MLQQLHWIIMHTRSSLAPISHPHDSLASPVPFSMPAYHHHPLLNYQHATEVISRNDCDRVRRCKAPPLWQSKGGRHGCLHHPSAFKHRGATAKSHVCGSKYQQSGASVWLYFILSSPAKKIPPQHCQSREQNPHPSPQAANRPPTINFPSRGEAL